MVISRSLGRKRKVRTNKRRMMRGGELDYRSDEYRAIKQLTYTGQSTYYDDDSRKIAEDRQLRNHILNLNSQGSTTANGYLMTVKGDKLVVNTKIKWECSIPVLNDYLESRNLPKINYNRSYQSQSKPDPIRPPPTRDKLLLNSNKNTFLNVLKNPLSLFRGDFTEAKKWFHNEFLKVIVPAADITPVISVGANPIPSYELMDERKYSYADSIINFYNYANSKSNHKQYFKKELIEIFQKFRAVSEFEKNKSTYMVLLMDDEVTRKLIEEYDSLNMVDKIISKYALIEKIMEVVAKYSKEELEAAKVNAFNETAPSGTSNETAKTVGVGVSAVDAAGRTMNYKDEPSVVEVAMGQTNMTMDEYLEKKAKSDPKLAESIREAEEEQKRRDEFKKEAEANKKAREEQEKNDMLARIDAEGQKAGISDDERVQWTERNNALSDVERYESNYDGNYFSQINKNKRLKQMEEDKKKFKTKADEKQASEKTHAHFETINKIADDLIDQGKKLGKTIEAYDKIKGAATILRDIAETKEVIEDETITTDHAQDTKFRRREYAWSKAQEAYNELKKVVPRYRSDLISKIDTITINIGYWVKFNGDNRSDRYETSTTWEQMYAMGGKSKRRKSMKRRKFKKRSTKRRR